MVSSISIHSCKYIRKGWVPRRELALQNLFGCLEGAFVILVLIMLVIVIVFVLGVV